MINDKVFINDLDENVSKVISKFAEDTKIDGVVHSEECWQRMQHNIDQVENGQKNGGLDLIWTMYSVAL